MHLRARRGSGGEAQAAAAELGRGGRPPDWPVAPLGAGESASRQEPIWKRA
jgi:hypothetical protein